MYDNDKEKETKKENRVRRLECNGTISDVMSLSARLDLCTESTHDKHFSILRDLARERRL